MRLRNAIAMLIGAVGVALTLAACDETRDHGLIAGGEGRGCIRLATQDPPTLRAAETLRRHLAEATGVDLPVLTRGVPHPGGEILLGWGEEARAAAPDLEGDAFVWRGDGDGRLLIGGPEGGTLYGVHAFLEEHLGFRHYAPGAKHVPELERVDLPRLSETRSPAFPVRWVHLPGAEHQAWCDWHGVHSRAHRNASWGMYVHTFETLVPPEAHFDEHPEYYSEIQGLRLPNQQLCLTNEEVFHLVVAGLRERMAERPDARYWSVSQNDRHGPCECVDCRRLVEEHGGEAGPLLRFVNRVAAEFPDRVISTLAYSYTRRAPRGLVPAPNVNICLCSIECDRAQTLADGPRNADFVRDIEEWSALTDNLMIWDYVVQFTNYISPFPNFHVLQPNIQLFRDHGAQLMFQQGSGASRSDLSELKQYLIAKLLWNPDRDVDALVDDFLAGYYGEAAAPMRRYFDLMQRSLLDSGAGLGIYGGPGRDSATWLKPAVLAEAEAILAEAALAAEGRGEIERRVRAAGLSVAYARLEQGKLFGAEEHGLFEAAPAGGWRLRKGWTEKLETFVAGCLEGGFETIHERNAPPEGYGERMRRFFAEGMVDHLAAGRPLAIGIPYSAKYPAKGDGTLVDGLKGINDYWFSWLGWKASDMSVTVDLEQTREVGRLAADFLQVVASWVWLPREVRWRVSTDGKSWETVAALTPENPERRGDPFVERFECRFPPRPARYVRLEATAAKHCPPWHHGAGGDAWIFCDEVMVFE